MTARPFTDMELPRYYVYHHLVSLMPGFKLVLDPFPTLTCAASFSISSSLNSLSHFPHVRCSLFGLLSILLAAYEHGVLVLGRFELPNLGR